jgi:DNA-directed RNA polymerase subunit M/transcription elongation factor TFIIS
MSKKRNLLDLFELKKELGPFKYCMNPKHEDRKVLALEFQTFPIRKHEHNWVNVLFFHFWIDEDSIKKLPDKEPETILTLISYVLSGNEAFGITCERCFYTVGATSQMGVLIPRKSYSIGESVQCPRCGKEGKLGFAMRKDKKYLAVYHGKIRHLIRTTEPIKHTEKEECPKCHELGRRYEDKQGPYFVHYDKGKRRKCRIK